MLSASFNKTFSFLADIFIKALHTFYSINLIVCILRTDTQYRKVKLCCLPSRYQQKGFQHGSSSRTSCWTTTSRREEAVIRGYSPPQRTASERYKGWTVVLCRRGWQMMRMPTDCKKYRSGRHRDIKWDLVALGWSDGQVWQNTERLISIAGCRLLQAAWRPRSGPANQTTRMNVDRKAISLDN